MKRLRDAGASEEQIRDADDRHRLAILPTELLLTRDLRYALEEVAELSGLDEDFVVRNLVATGMVRPEPGERVLSELNLEQSKGTKRALDFGLAPDAVLRISRVFNRGIAQVAEGTVDVLLMELLKGAADEVDFALRAEELTRALRDDLSIYLEATMETHLRERLAREAIGRAEVEAGSLPGAREVAICFADLVEFTRLSEQTQPEEVGDLATRFADLAEEVAEPPVRLVKMIGDEAMLVSEDLEPLVAAAFLLVQKAGEANLPALRVGVASGLSLARARRRLVWPHRQLGEQAH